MNNSRLPSPASGQQGASQSRSRNTASTFPFNTPVIVKLVTDAEDFAGWRVIILYTDNTGICGWTEKSDKSPSGDSPIRLFPWASVEVITRLTPLDGAK